MKKNLLLIMMCIPAVLAAQNGVTVTGLAVDAGTVTFNVSWNKNNPDMPELWSDTVWVFVDYNVSGKMERLPLITSGATLTTHTAPAGVGKVVEETGNEQGMWVVGNARSVGSFSATVQLLTATSTATGICAYASNYPPVGDYITASTIKFTGTPMYNIVIKHSGDSHTEERKSDSPFSVPDGFTVESFTDKTGAPGFLKCIPATKYDLTASATEFCSGTTVTFALSNTVSGRTYQLYKGGNVVNTLTGTGSAATFTGTFGGDGVYTAQVTALGSDCGTTMTGEYAVSERLLPTAPVINKPADVCYNAGALVFTATGYSGTVDWTSNGGGTVNNSTVTFASGATTGTKTVSARSAQTYTTLTCYSSTTPSQSANINALPDNPIGTNGLRCDSGTITISASSSGAVIDWYAAATDGGVLANGSATSSFTTPSISAPTTYYAQARNSTTGCISAARTAVTATVNAVPTITYLSSGGTNQTVNADTAITAIKYTTANATGASASNLPAGIAGSWSSNTFTISGSSTVTGAKVYTVTTANSNGCTNATASGTITVVATTPPNASSTQTWVVSGSQGSQTWSAPINIPACNKTTYSASNTTADCRNNGSYGYLYSWTYVKNNATTLCPSPWRVPTSDDFCTLDKILYNTSTCTNRSGVNGGTTYSSSTWGGTYGGWCESNGSLHGQSSYALYWSTTEISSGSTNAYYLEYTSSTVIPKYSHDKFYGVRVRCVK